MSKVELYTAYEWVCDACGRNNFCSSVHMDMSDRDNEAALREAFGLEGYETIPDDIGGEWCTRPERVKCGHCDAEFETADV